MSDEIISKALGLPSMPNLDSDTEKEIEIVEETEESITIETPDNSTDLVEYVENDPVHVEHDAENTVSPIFESEIDKEYLDDVSKAKKNVSQMIVDGHGAFERLIIIATQTENPTAFDSASKLLKTLVDANKEMANLSHMKRDAKTMKNTDSNGITNNTTNNTVILTTAEILKTLKR